MALERGKLIVREKKGGGQTILVQLGDKPAMNVAQGEVSQSLLSRLTEFKGKDVEFERIDGQPKRVREPGGIFRAPEPAAAANPGRRDDRGHDRMNRDARSTQPGPQHRNKPMATQRGDFHNPYNFIPAPPRNTSHPELGDHEPVSHDSFDLKRYTGILRVRMVAKTPLLLPDTEGVQEADNGHKTYPLRVRADGIPLIPASSVRGMLRSAYEAVTNSRFGRFSINQHRDRLAFRMDARDGLKLIPARVENGQFRLMTGTSRVGQEGRPEGPMYAAWLPRYSNGQVVDSAIRYSDGSLPAHGDEVQCWLEFFQHHRWDQRQNNHVQDFQYWKVRCIVRHSETPCTNPGPSNAPRCRDHQSWHQPADQPLIQVRGWVCVTNANINRKHDERVFFVAADAQPPGPFPVTEGHRQMWRELIANYQSIHKDDLDRRRQQNQAPDAYLGGDPGRTAWSRHVYTRDDLELRDGTLCYVRLNGAQTDVEAIFPVMIARELYAKSPWDLLHESLRPASAIGELSPADRVFGWVHADADRSSIQCGSRVAARGLLRIGPVRCESTVAESVETFGNDGVPLAILSTPKPQQGRFYVANTPQGEAQARRLSKAEAGYSEGKGLRGRKVYPHQKNLPASHWQNPTEDRTQTAVGTPPHYQEYRRPKKDQREQRDDQNRSIRGWVKPGAAFVFDVHVQNLSKVELGALLWLLNLPDGHYFRFGGGKPLGFGSVRLSLDSCDVRTGAELAARYVCWHEEQVAQDPSAEAIAAYKEALASAYPQNGTQTFDAIPFIRAFKTACQGHLDGLPVHYPRVTSAPNPDGESFRWFVANERDDARHPLADLCNDPGLPILQDRQANRGGIR